MPEAIKISALARQTGVTSKAIRYWESLGLLPKAGRTHTGYRVFDPESIRYVGFIRKAKTIGLTLAETREVLRLARAGRCPCPEVLRWTNERVKSLESQLDSLLILLKRLKRIQRQWPQSACSVEQCGDVCSLVDGLPEVKSYRGGKPHAKILAASGGRSDGSCCGCGPGRDCGA